MINDSNRSGQVPTAIDPCLAPVQSLAQVPQVVDAARIVLNTRSRPAATAPGSHSNPGLNWTGPGPVQFNTPLAGSLNSMPSIFYIKATAAQLKAINQSAPEDVPARIKSNASKEVRLDDDVCSIRWRILRYSKRAHHVCAL